METEATAALDTFSAEYGKLCTLTAQALQRGACRSDILNAAQGKGSPDKLPELRHQWEHVREAAEYAYGIGVTMDNMRHHMIRSRRAVEGEWDVRIPLIA